MRKLIIISILLTILSCETWDYAKLNELNFGDEQHRIEVFVQGGITTQFATHRIALFKPSDYIEQREQEEIADATVFVTSDTDTFTFHYAGLGYYESAKKFQAEINRKYTLNILYNGRTYKGTDSVVASTNFEIDKVPLPQKENLDYCPFDAGDCITLISNKHYYGFPESNFWRWETQELFTDTLNYLLQGLGVSYTHQYADIQGLFANIEYHFQVGFAWQPDDTLVALKFSVSDNYYNYLRTEFIETDWKEGVFSSIPGNLPTNLSEGGTGYFFASDVFIKKIPLVQFLEMNQ